MTELLVIPPAATRLSKTKWDALVAFMREMALEPSYKSEWAAVEITLHAPVMILGEWLAPGVYWGPR